METLCIQRKIISSGKWVKNFMPQHLTKPAARGTGNNEGIMRLISKSAGGVGLMQGETFIFDS